jgi:hypothetical protein
MKIAVPVWNLFYSVLSVFSVVDKGKNMQPFKAHTVVIRADPR